MNYECKKELLAILKKHGVTSFGMLCYNDPDKVKELEAFDEDKWNEKFNAWIVDNPEPTFEYNGEWYSSPEYKEYLSNHRSWEAKRDAEVGPPKEDLTDDLFTEYYDCVDYTPGLWYSSRC